LSCWAELGRSEARIFVEAASGVNGKLTQNRLILEYAIFTVTYG
jgi:hypothetical protein